jgi:hypothetical protein
MHCKQTFYQVSIMKIMLTLIGHGEGEKSKSGPRCRWMPVTNEINTGDKPPSDLFQFP